MTQLSISEKDEGDRRTLILSGPVNSYTYTELQEKLTAALDLAATIVVDMEKVTNLSSAGVGVLMASLDDAEGAGKRLVILKPSEIARLSIEATGFGDRFVIVQTAREL
jgi:anti-anti-sigma factor